jgi:hypothetical protein
VQLLSHQLFICHDISKEGALIESHGKCMPKTINNDMLYFNIKGNNGAMRVWEWGLTSLLPNKIEIGLQPLTPLTPKGSNSHHNPRAFGSRPILFHYQY